MASTYVLFLHCFALRITHTKLQISTYQMGGGGTRPMWLRQEGVLLIHSLNIIGPRLTRVPIWPIRPPFTVHPFRLSHGPVASFTDRNHTQYSPLEYAEFFFCSNFYDMIVIGLLCKKHVQTMCS